MEKKTGIDVQADWEEIRALSLSVYGRRCRTHGYDPDDFLQQVAMGILARNNGRGRWDPERGRKKSSYIVMVARSVWSHYHSRKTRERERFVLDDEQRESMRRADVVAEQRIVGQLHRTAAWAAIRAALPPEGQAFALGLVELGSPTKSRRRMAKRGWTTEEIERGATAVRNLEPEKCLREYSERMATA